MAAPTTPRISSGLTPGDLGAIVHWHGVLYAREWGLDATFEPYVAEPLAHFAKGYPDTGEIWIARDGAAFAGSLAVVVSEPGAGETNWGQIRWVLLRPEYRGGPTARALMDAGVGWARSRGLSRLILWTFDDLAAARRLYERYGFVECERKASRIWGREITEVRMELVLG